MLATVAAVVLAAAGLPGGREPAPAPAGRARSADHRRQRRLPGALAGLRPRAGQRRGRALRLRAHVRGCPALDRGLRPGPLPRGDAARAGPARRLPALPHPARPGPGDPLHRLGRLQHRLQPLARRGPVRDRFDPSRPAPRGRGLRGQRPLSARGPALPDPGGPGRARRAAELHRGRQRPVRAPPLVGQLRLRAPHPGRRPRRPRGRRERRAGEPALGRRVPARHHARTSARWPGGSPARRRSPRSWASTPTWCSRSGGSTARSSSSARATWSPTRTRPAARRPPRTG